jgi:aspartate racemase
MVQDSFFSGAVVFKKTIGILGGMGPRATSIFYETLLNSVGPTKRDAEYPRVVISSNPKMPSRTRAFLYGETDPTPFLVRELEGLKNQGADFFVCPCNSAHYFLSKKENLPLPFLSILDVTYTFCLEQNITKLVLLSGEVPRLSKIFEQKLENILTIIYPAEKDLFTVRNFIDICKGNHITKKDITDWENFILSYASNVNFLLGCTELAIIARLSKKNIPDVNLYDTNVILARATLEEAR